MRHNPIKFVRCLIVGVTGCAIYIALAPVSVFGEQPTSQTSSPPKIDPLGGF
jgi:hypothetical protein